MVDTAIDKPYPLYKLEGISPLFKFSNPVKMQNLFAFLQGFKRSPFLWLIDRCSLILGLELEERINHIATNIDHGF